MMSPMCNALAYVLRELRKLRKLSLEELAEASGVCRTMISYVERRLTRLTVEIMEKLAKALAVAADVLLKMAIDLEKSRAERDVGGVSLC